MIKRTIGMAVMAVFITGILAACGGGDTASGSNENEESKGTINIGVTPWTSTVPPTEVATIILEDMGYKVEQTQADAGAVYSGLARGDLGVFMDGWFPLHENYMDKFSDSLDETAISYADAEVGWTVPTYLEDINSIDDIKGNEDLFGGEMYGIEEGASATETSRQLIDGENLNMEQVASSEGGMLSQVSRKISSEEPVVFYGWRPHTMFNDYDLKVLDGQDEYFKSADVKVITNKNFADEKPEAYEFLSNWSMPLEDVEKMIVEIDDNDRDPREVAQEWIDNNQDKVNDMLGK